MSYISEACASVDGFLQRYEFLTKVMQNESKSSETIASYTRNLAKFCVRHKRLPEQISEQEYVEYYNSLIQGENASRGQIKHAVFSIRYYFRTFPQYECPIHATPSIPHNKKLPVVLSVDEIKAMLRVTTNLLHKSAIALLYGAGLRVGELIRLKICDVDFGRMCMHVKQGKGRKDRYVPLSKNLAKVLRAYFAAFQPKQWVLEHDGVQYTKEGVAYMVGLAAKRGGIAKRVHCHTLRHSFATHQLEFGISILDVQANLGHANLRTTTMYLHVANMPDRKRNISPLDIIYPVKA